MPDGVQVQGPDGKTYQFPAGTDKTAAISYFKKKGIGAPSGPTPIADKSSISAPPSELGRLGKEASNIGRASVNSKFPYVHPLDAINAATGAAEGEVIHNAPKPVTELLLGGQAAGKPMGTREGIVNNPVTMALSAAPDAAIGASKSATTLGDIFKSGEPLARINKLLGVGAREIRVGSVPDSLDEFASNPARGVTKAGIQEKQLAKMNPMERLQAVSKARDAAGSKLDQVLNASPDKTINVQKVVQDTFSQIPDKRLAKIATTRLQQILAKANITKPLSQLTPMEARTVQRGLDDFANFSSGETAKTFGDVATSLRRGISQATRKAIPETAELDQDYGDLAGATKAVRKQVNKYARTVPESRLRKMMPHIIGGSIGGGIAGGVARQILPSH